MTTELDEQDSSTLYENIDGVSVLSALLLSLLLKVEDRECRVKDTISPSTDDEADEKESDTEVLFLDGDVITRHHDSDSRDTRSPFEMMNVQTRLKMRPDDRADTYYTVNEAELFVNDSKLITTSSSSIKSEFSDEDDVFLSRYKSEDDSSHDVILTTQLGRGDTSNQTYESVYQESAVRIVRDAMLRAIANIFTNGIIRRGLRSSGQAVQNITDYRRENWNISTNVCNGNEDQDVTSDAYVGQSMVPMSVNKNQIKPKADVISPEWLCDVNRQIAASEVPVARTDWMPPSVASSCNVSRCSSVDILSSGDRIIKVKATPPSQSKLLWRMVQKMHDSNGSTVVKQPADEDHSVYDPVNDVRNTEKKVNLLSEALSRAKEDPTLRVRLLSEHEKSTEHESSDERRHDTLNANDRLVQFRDSAARTENTNFKRADKSTRADEVNDKVSGKEATTTSCPAVTDGQLTKELPTTKTDKIRRQIKQRSLPPFANPLLMDVVWRNSSNCNMTAQEMMYMKTSFARGSEHEAQRAKSVVELALHRAVSSLFVDKLINESHASLTSQLRITSSFKEAAANLTELSPLCFQWFPYLEENSVGPCKATDQRRKRGAKTNETGVPPQKQGSGNSSDVYQDARENFGSSDDLLIDDGKGHTGSSGDDEFTDAVCDSDFSKSKVNTKKTIPGFTDENIQTEETECQIPITVDKATQVTHTAEGKDSSASPSDEIEDDLKRATVGVELPLDSINYIKDQFNDVKVLVAKYRELLYEPLQEDNSVSAGPAHPKTNAKPNNGQARKAKNIPGRQSSSPELEDDTDEDDELGDAIAKKPSCKHRRSEKEKGNYADVRPTLMDAQSDWIVRDKKQTSEDKSDVQETEETGNPDQTKEQKMDSSPGREMASADQFVRKELSSEDENSLDSTSKPKPSEKSDKSKDKRKKRDSSPSRDKKGFRRTLRKTGEKRRTPTGRLRPGTIVTEKTTRDGFLPLNVKGQLEKAHKSERQDTTATKKDPSPSGKSTEKEEELGTSSKPTDEEKPKVKNRISFFEKFSKHSMKKECVSSQPSNSTSPEIVTPVKQVIMNLEKMVKLSASKQKVGTQKDDDKKLKHKENMHGSKDTGKSRDKISVGKQEDTESGVDSTPGKGIWTNAAFFEALVKPDDPKIGTKKSPTTAKRILEDGLLDETRNNENKRPATRGENERVNEKARSRRSTSKTSPEKTDANSNIASSWKKKKARNKNTNNQDVTDQRLTTDDSCISNSQCSDSQMKIEKDDANVVKSEEVIIEKNQSSEKLNCDEEMATEPKTTDGSCISSRQCSDIQMENDQDNTYMVKSKEINLNQKQSSEKCNSDAKAKTLTDDLLTTNTETEEPFYSPCESMESQNHQLHMGLGTSEAQNEEDFKITLPDEDYEILDKLSLLNDVISQDMEIHSPTPTRDLDDISSLNNFDGPLLASSPRPKRTLKKSNTSSVDSTEANGTSEPTPPIHLDDSDDDDDEVLHKLRNASFLIACNPDYCDNKEDIIKNDFEVGEREDYDQQEERGPTKSTEYLQSITGVPGTTVHMFTPTAHPIRLNHERCGTSSEDMIDGEHDTNSRIKSPTDESARPTFNKKKSWLRFNFFRKSKRRIHSKSKKMTLQQSDTEQKTRDIGSIPNEEQHTPVMVSEDDAVTIATRTCTNKEINTSIDSSLMPVCSQKRKFGFKSLRKSKKPSLNEEMMGLHM